MAEQAEIVPGQPMAQKLPIGAGDSLESVGALMIVVSLVIGAVSIFAFGRVPEVEAGILGPRVSHAWSGVNVLIVLIGTAWSVGLSYAVRRLGTLLRWAEAIGKRHDITEG